jgi:glyoxylase-like metal-dependent hydrolase (beta-lactamase superfamily II)
MPKFMCKTCGTQYPESELPPEHCPICEDERQYIGWDGQQWTTLEELLKDHHNVLKPQEANLTGIGTEPGFAISQRALLVQAPSGNILWDCISLIDDATIEAVNALGGISAMAISHPHYYSSMVEWSYAFGNVPIYIHAADQQWVMRPDPVVKFWEGTTYSLGEGLTLINCGGHFEGGTVLHWAAGVDGKGALFSGDILTVVSDRRYVSFMRSYPNLIPLNRSAIFRILKSLEPYRFERIYGAWFDRVVQAQGKHSVWASADRYLKAIETDR